MTKPTAKDTVRAWVDAMDRGDVKTAMAMLTPDAQIVGPAPQPLTRDEFSAMHQALAKAFPDWNFHASDYRQTGDQVTVQFDITGTQRGDLTLPLPGVPTIRATSLRIRQPTEQPTFTVQNGVITRLVLPQVAGGGVMGILTQLGVTMPATSAGRISAPSYP
jgi:predicted ester cyclase